MHGLDFVSFTMIYLVNRILWFTFAAKAENMTKERRQQIIEAIRKKAKEITPPGSEVILFGSQARGDARDDSDWDVLILLDKDRVQLNDYDEYSYPLREMGWGMNADINPVLYTKKRWLHDVYTPFHKNVNNDGIYL